MSSPTPSTSASTSAATTSAPQRHPSSNVHLLVLIHGMWGNPSHLGELDRVIRETKEKASLSADSDARLEVFLPQSNTEDSTYDGIDWGGERVAQEILDYQAKLSAAGETLTKISVTGYSLGGVIARYVLGVLHQRGFFDSVRPVNFNTLATPHIGLPRYDTVLGKVFRTLGPKLLSKTGTQFYATDEWGPRKRPIVEVMADPEQIFYKALCLFPNIVIYANAINDPTVPYVTAAIETSDPFHDYATSGLDIEYIPGYKPLVASFTKSANGPPKKTAFERVSGFITQKNPGPPGLTFGFPGNLVMWGVLPFLMPLFFGLAYTRLSLSARGSHKRIAELEAEPADGSVTQRLVHAVAHLERGLEGAVADMAGVPRDDALHAATPEAATPETASLADVDAGPQIEKTPTEKRACGPRRTPSTPSASNDKPSASAPILSEMQVRIVGQLNAIPQLRKHTAYIDSTRFGHAAIVGREAKKFGWKPDVYGALQHWADHFEL